MRCRPSSSWHLFLLLHAPKQFQRMNTLETITEEPNEAIGAQTKSEHRCEASKSKQITESLSKSKEKIRTRSETINEEKEINKEEITFRTEHSSSEREGSEGSLERSRKQWETSPDQMKEISRSLSELNVSQFEKNQQKSRTKRSKSKENLVENQRTTLPPINSSDSDSGRELIDTCICEGMYKSNGAIDNQTDSNQWIVSRPIRNKPKDNLRMEGVMEMETTFKNTYDSTAKHINESNSKNVAIVLPSNKLSSEETNFERLKASKINEFNTIRASKKKPKHRPSTSLKAGGDGYFNTINKESYKNFVIIDDKPIFDKTEKAINCNGKKTSVCCSTLSNIKLPKVDTINREDNQQYTKRKTGDHLDHQSSQMEQINRSMQRMTTSDRSEHKNISEKTQTNGNFVSYVDSSAQTNHDFHQTDETKNQSHSRIREQMPKESTSLIAHHKEDPGHDLQEANTSWTVGSLEEHKRVYTRDVDSIKELGLLDKSDQQVIRQIQRISEEDNRNKAFNENKFESTERSRDTTRVRYESKNYVQQQRRQKKHKNESSMRLFDGDMDFTTTTRTCFSDKSPNRAEPKRVERERTAGKKSRKSGKKRNLFRTSTEAQFYEPYGETTQKTTQTTYQRQFGDRLYCPVIDLGSNRSDFKYRGEASGHKFFLPAVNN